MSYDIYLYDESFLRRALETNLDDWTGADPIPQAAIDRVVATAQVAGFVAVPSETSAAFNLDTEAVFAELSVSRSEIAFTIPYGERAEASIELCARLARRLAADNALGFWDPQDGSLEGDEDDTEVWLEALRSGEPKMREVAAVQLAGHEARLVVGALATAARHDALEDVRRKALESLGELGERAAATVDDVIACLSDPNPVIQYWATFALGRLGPLAERALPALERLTHSPEYGPRYGALDAIRRIRERCFAKAP